MFNKSFGIFRPVLQDNRLALPHLRIRLLSDSYTKLWVIDPPTPRPFSRMNLWSTIEDAVQATTGVRFTLNNRRRISGGCINETFVIEGASARYFVKVNNIQGLAMFEAEAEGLRELAKARAVRVPAPVCAGSTQAQAFLVMEYIPLAGKPDMVRLGQQLALLHRTRAARFGWYRNNTIGATPQINTETADWCTFWREHRLGLQLGLAARRGGSKTLREKGGRLMERLPALFADYTPTPALLHGDLWGGNIGADDQGNPVIFDPAVYYGDREADLAMTQLFGGFDPAFYRTYEHAYPLDPGYAVRKPLYNLYHVLNHFNLFGGGYGLQAERMLERLLAELG